VSRGSGSSPLSRREREVAALVAEGLTDHAIARRLFISGRTAEGHVRQILNKLGLDNRAQIASWATKARLAVEGGAPADAVTAALHNLPPQMTSFVGRERELAEMRRLLQRVRVLTISGPGGSGKTRLAVEAATALLHRFPDGVWFLDLASTSDPNVVPRSIASALGISGKEDADPLDTVAAELAGGRRPHQALLLLDNCEHLIERCATTVARLLRATPQLTFLCTSREPLHIIGEAIWRLSPLPLPETRVTLSAEVVRRADAARLFLDRVSLSDPQFVLDESNAAEVAHLCQRLDGIPLALELAAAHAGLMPFPQLQLHLERRFSDLRVRDVPSRQQTLSATLDWSYDLLGEPERRLLRRLSVFRGGFTWEAVQTVCMDPVETAGADTFELLAMLVDKSLVLPVPGRAERYRCLEIIRQDAGARLAESGELEPMRRRHLDHFLELAERAAPELSGPEQSSWLQRLSDDHDNLRAALETARTYGIDRRLRLMLALGRFWTARGYLGEGRQWMTEALAAAGTAATPLLAEALNTAAGLAWQQGDIASARTHLEASAAMWRELGDRARIQPSLTNLGLVAATQGDWQAARSWNAESLALARQLGDEPAVAVVLSNLGRLLGHLGEHEAAQAHLDEALAIMRRLGDSVRIAVALSNLGMLAVLRDRAGEAAERYGESLRILRSLGARQNVAECLEGFAWIAARTGDLERALWLAGAAAASRDELGTPVRPSSRRLLEDWMDRARAALGEDADRAWDEGRNMQEQRALALALGEHQAASPG